MSAPGRRAAELQFAVLPRLSATAHSRLFVVSSVHFGSCSCSSSTQLWPGG
jgi:hypothetical protein